MKFAGPRMRVAARRPDGELTVVCCCGCGTRTGVRGASPTIRVGMEITVLSLITPGVQLVRR